ncbi:anti-sigma B factor antagonist [Kribbella amoyensis]|uniref:Anti-sigma factor antagonist n=1 Tax=Kribbella amoyensis TaxID=996641 RepID=A0A561B2B9_9ACTN|nr:STAS domain-containing protein [Kribbella amoyensis]TWD73003.1 anti-sigma B factor antagonist [Kribbella amoyensis]
MTESARVDARTSNDVQVVRIYGEVDLTNAVEVRDAISRVASADVTVIVVDLSETGYLDSSGIAMLFRLAERAGERRQELRVVVPPDSPLRAALELTNLPRTIPVLPTLE